MGWRAVFYGVLTKLLLGFLLHGLDNFAKAYINDLHVLWPGCVAIFTLITLVCYAFAWKWTNIHSWPFYFFLPLFLTSSFDFFNSVDIWLDPDGYFLSQYVQANAPHFHHVCMAGYIFFDAFVLHLHHFIALFRLSQGESIRSLLIISCSAYVYLAVNLVDTMIASELPWHPLSISFIPIIPPYVLLIFGAFKMSRSFRLSTKHDEIGDCRKCLSRASILLLIIAAGIIVAKALVLLGLRNQVLDVVRLNDPIIFLDDVEKSFPPMAAMIWQNVIMVLPLLILCLIHHFQTSKPTYLWDVAMVNLGFVLEGQFVAVSSSFFWKTPKALQADPWNLMFWIINVIPVMAVLMQVVYLLPYKVPLVSTSAKTKKS